ncbi:hypothetical protein [Nocardiopsis coralliicola]
MSSLERLSESDRAELDQAVFASFGRMMTGAPAPEGTVTIAADDRDDFRRQFHELFGTGDEEHGDSQSDADPVRAPRAADDPTPGAS